MACEAGARQGPIDQHRLPRFRHNRTARHHLVTDAVRIFMNEQPRLITLAELVGKLDLLEIKCHRCDRHGRVSLARLIDNHGEDRGLPDLWETLAGAYPNARSAALNERCAIFSIAGAVPAEQRRLYASAAAGRRLRFFSYIVAKRLSTGFGWPISMALSFGIGGKGRVGSQTAQHSLGSSSRRLGKSGTASSAGREYRSCQDCASRRGIRRPRGCTPGRLPRWKFGRCARGRREPPCAEPSGVGSDREGRAAREIQIVAHGRYQNSGVLMISSSRTCLGMH